MCVRVRRCVCDWPEELSGLGSVGYCTLLWFCVSLVSLWVVGECCLGWVSVWGRCEIRVCMCVRVCVRVRGCV